MEAGRLKRRKRLFLPVLGLLLFILVSLHLMSSATQEASELGEMYSWLLLINSLGSFLLLGLVSANALWLFRQFSKKAIGSRLTARIVMLFIILSLAPSSVVFYYSLQFLHRSIDSWFDVQVDHAMDEALQLSQASLDERMRNLLKQTEQANRSLDVQSDTLLAIELDDLRNNILATELTVFSKSREIIAYSSASPVLLPELPNDTVLLQLRRGEPYVNLQPGSSDELFIQVVVPTNADNSRFLQALYPLSSRISNLANSIESAYVHYKELTFLRNSLKFTFSLTLSLVLLVSLLATIWIAFLSSKRLVKPVRDLVRGTQAVAEGNYEQKIALAGKDELGFLVESFNDMTSRIGQARDLADKSQIEIETQRNYLEAILASLSTGVISFDRELNILTANRAACNILRLDETLLLNHTLDEIAASSPNISRLINTIQERSTGSQEPWQEECAIFGGEGRQILMIRGTSLYDSSNKLSGALVVFDDVTTLVQAQRDAAWGEVAKRLAHEIKNPLTPIQLSAERIQHKLSAALDEKNGALLKKSTHTIVQQVEAMKTMVKEFSDYARPPSLKTEQIDLEKLLKEIIALYASKNISIQLNGPIEPIPVDPLRIRQLFHNLIKNSLEATESSSSQQIKIVLEKITAQDRDFLQIAVEDNGSGLPKEQLDTIFDPYVTTKEKGTGLGLAIVKKIIDEHGGIIWADRDFQNGARFVVRLPYSQIRRTTA